MAARLRQLYDIEGATVERRSSSPRRPLTDDGDEDGAEGGDGAEFARAPLRGWAGRMLLPTEWAADVATTYVTLRLEVAQRRAGVRLLDPALPLLVPMALA